MPYEISYEFREGGVLADPEAVVLASEDGAFGVRRMDSGATIVVSGTAMVKQSTGVYAYTVADNPSGVDIEYVVRAEVAGAYVYARNLVNLSSSGGTVNPSGRYATTDGMYTKFGQLSVDKWATINGDIEAQRQATIRDAIDRADAYVDSALYDAYTVPFTVAGEGIPHIIRDIANRLAGVYLYQAQGVLDFDPESGLPNHRFSSMEKLALKDLAKIKAGHLVLQNTSGTLLKKKHMTIAAG